MSQHEAIDLHHNSGLNISILLACHRLFCNNNTKIRKFIAETHFNVTRASASIAISKAFISASITSGVLSESGAGGGALYGLENGTNFNSLGICTARRERKS